MASNTGFARITVGSGQGNYLTEYNGYAVCGLGTSTDWAIQLYGNPTASNPTYIIALSNGLSPQLVLTLDNNGVNIVLRQLQSPPSNRQLWTFQDAISQLRYPQILYARIQSVEAPGLSVTPGAGAVALPRLYLSVGAAPNDSTSDVQKWTLDYFLP